MQNKGNYAGSRSVNVTDAVKMEGSYATSYWRLIITDRLLKRKTNKHYIHTQSTKLKIRKKH